MSQAASANAWVRTFTAGGVINPGHAVVISAGTVVECTAADTFFGVYIGTEACASGDLVSICVGGICKVFADGTSAISIGSLLGNDSSGHFAVNATDKDLIAGRALEALASGTGFIEAVVGPAIFNAV